ncbi:MAG: ABC transporter permease [Gemmata sp.]
MLIGQSFQRHWRVRQMGLVSLALLAIVVGWVAFDTARGAWDVAGVRLRLRPSQKGHQRQTHAQEAARLGRDYRYTVLLKGDPAELRENESPNLLDPTADALATLVLSAPKAAIESQPYRRSWAFLTYSRWALFLVFMGFVLPLFTMSYASAAFGSERESRSLIWVMTRPIPRGAIYLAKLLGALPWCLAFGLGGFVLICSVSGAPGREGLVRYWPAVTAATVAFAALFHLVGALVKRPVVIGLVYVFFYEAVVAILPGSLKLLSLTFYARSLMYNEAAVGHDPELVRSMLPVMTEAVSTGTAWAVMLTAPVVITAGGMWLFSQTEYRDA